jgi:hypothetical protein
MLKGYCLPWRVAGATNPSIQEIILAMVSSRKAFDMESEVKSGVSYYIEAG